MNTIYRHPWLNIAIIALITLFFGFQLPNIELENNNIRFVPPNDEAFLTSKAIDEMFGSSLFILVGLERRYGSIFESEFLSRITNYINTIEEIPVVKSVTSIVNAQYITSIDEAIVVEKLISDDFSGAPSQIEELKRRLLSWDMYERALYSDDFTATQILVSLGLDMDSASTSETTEQFLMIRDIAHETFSDLATVHVTGLPIIVSSINEAMDRDLIVLIPIVVLVALAVLFFSFRSFTPVVLPLLTVLVSVIWSVGAMPLLGFKLSVISTVLPVILVAVGSAYGIHVVTHYLARVKKQGDITSLSFDEHRDLVLEVTEKIRKPVFLAALTTFFGFVSFCFTTVAPCREFGYFASFGVAAAFTNAILLIPSLLIIRGPKKIIAKETSKEESPFNTFVADNLMILASRKKTIVFLSLIVIAFSFYGLSKLIIDNAMIEYFKPETGIYRSDEFVRRQFGGSKVVSLVVEADTTEALLHPDTLAAMDGLSDYLYRNVPNAGKVMGFTDLVKRINQVFNADQSPEGLMRINANEDIHGFSRIDTDLGFGFGDFGFNDYVSSPSPVTPSRNVSSIENVEEKTFTRQEIVGIFDRAASGRRGMNANEFVWEVKRQINYEGASYYEIPSIPERYGMNTREELYMVIANYLALLAGNIDEYANDPLEPTAIKSTIQLRTTGMDDSNAIFKEIEEYAAAHFPPDTRITMGGNTMVEISLNNHVVSSQIISMLFSIICVFLIIAISNKSLIAGFIGIIPLSISILLNFAVMGFSGIKLNLGTSMVAAVSIGVGIDYTIHCLEAYKREFAASGGSGNFLRNVFLSSGKAIIINAVSVGAGFAVLMLSSFVILGDLGLLIALTMFSSAVVSLTLLPALLALLKPKFIYQGGKI